MSCDSETRKALWKDLTKKGNEFRSALLSAQVNVLEFQRSGNANRFPAVREYINLYGDTWEFPCDLSGWGTTLVLQGREYYKMRSAYYETEAGKKELEAIIHSHKKDKDNLLLLVDILSIGTIPMKYWDAKDWERFRARKNPAKGEVAPKKRFFRDWAKRIVGWI